ncbi:class F sortase [Nocardioides mangrovi]|uniref:Class F sortase n=1 Tax=Nocardioides mangrovi TaxID=2874580 RepID=A0ABS7UDB1_9ACTN|nr:class F sortase [Nocardioides mangrovi]MBZ5738877.1 class F sortase [Nocardioides mangrovi]
MRPGVLGVAVAVAAIVAAAGAVLTVVLVARNDPPAPAGADAADGSGPATPTVTVPAGRAERAGIVAAEAPTAVRLPSGRSVPVVAVGSRHNGVLDVPADVRSAGWWSGGSRLGDPFGSTLIAGHVDSVDQGLGAYAELLSVRPRQRVVLSSPHLRQTFSIVSLDLVAKRDTADVRRLSAASGGRRLTLVTCAPPYDAGRGGYQRLAVVTARPLAAATRRAP